MTTALTINDIKIWLQENRNEYLILKSQEYPPFNNSFYTTYIHLYDFFQYYKYIHQCETALIQLITKQFNNFSVVVKWTKENEILGADKLLVFEVNYVYWNTKIDNNVLKIHEGLYTIKKPFLNLICFCKVFQHLYWDNEVFKKKLSIEEKEKVLIELNRILENFYFTADLD